MNEGDDQTDVEAVRAISVVPSILEMICATTGMGFAAVARVTDRKWMACAVLDRVNFGLEAGGELPVRTTLCHEVRDQCREIVIDHVSEDPQYADHHTPRLYGLQSYISVPIVLGDGSFFGTLCAIDAAPAKLKDTPILGMVRLFAQLIARHLDDQRELAHGRTRLSQSREIGELREQFIAVLGHDLRNPLAALQAGITLLVREPQTEKARAVLGSMGQAADRMSTLIDNVLDFARGRLGGGISIELDASRPLWPTLNQVAEEIRAVYPARVIALTCPPDLEAPVDHARIGQLLSNLLGNAVTHGSVDRPILVDAGAREGHFELSVSNFGEPIAADVIDQLFQPFQRRKAGHRQEGLGLGLYISSEIARAHAGTIDVISDGTITRFTFRMPLETKGA